MIEQVVDAAEYFDVVVDAVVALQVVDVAAASPHSDAAILLFVG